MNARRVAVVQLPWVRAYPCLQDLLSFVYFVESPRLPLLSPAAPPMACVVDLNVNLATPRVLFICDCRWLRPQNLQRGGVGEGGELHDTGGVRLVSDFTPTLT